MEKEPRSKEIVLTKETLLSQKVAKRVRKVAEKNKLGELPQEALRKYANILLAAREINTDFLNTQLKEKTYNFGPAEDGNMYGITVTRKNYFNWTDIWSHQIMGLQQIYLDSNRGEITARKKILKYVQKLTPQNF